MLTGEVWKNKEDIIKFLENLGINPDNIKSQDAMLTAFIHKSYSADYQNEVFHNERLEFLGDSVLGLIIAKLLYIDNKGFDESRLTLYKIALVREETLASTARDIGLGNYLFLGKGEENSGGRTKDVILADAVEALIAYIYLDFGIEEAEKFIEKYIYSKLESIKKTKLHFKSYKSMLQERLQKEFKEIPEYMDIEFEKDAKNNILMYKSEVYIQGKKIGEGYGKNKKTAQEEAAKAYLENIKK